MIKKLRIKFVCIVLSVSLLMVGGILGVVLHFTEKNMQMQGLSMMRAVAADPFQQSNLTVQGDGVRLPFFTVQISSIGELITASGGYFDLSDREYIQQVINDALRSPDESGVLEEYELRYLKTVSQYGLSIVFADTATERATMRSLVQSCVLIFVAATAVFFGLSILLSRWAIKPVEAAWTQQRQFVADASHELKTPLSVIMANAELLQNGAEDKKFAQDILTTSYQMRSLVEELLEMARVDSGNVRMELAELDFSRTVRDAVMSFGLLYEERGLGLRSAVEDGIFVRGSEHHLFQVLDVLLDNALKYSAPGMVSVDLRRSGKSAVLSVASPGEPLSKAELRDIFKRFYRADKTRAMNGSYGLGLSIAESVVQAHSGKIRAESVPDGNVFYVRLPLLR